MPTGARGAGDRVDNRLYDLRCHEWWQPDSALHQFEVSFNPVRLGFARQRLLGALRLDPRGRKALEVGCGGGIVCEELARLGFETTGVDPSLPSLEVAARHARGSGLKVHYERGTGESLPHAAASYDAVFCCDVLEHVRDLRRVMSEISRVLKPGGVFYYDTLNRTWLSKLVAIKIGQQWRRWAFLPPELHVWSAFVRPAEMKGLLRQNRLEWKEHRGIKPGRPWLEVLHHLRRRARGECGYAELGERVPLVESRFTTVMYMGYAIKLP